MKRHLLILQFFLPLSCLAQCIVVPANGAYIAEFETSNEGWTTGGSLSSWAWGTPSKPIINAAAAGLRCWITGGLSGTAYNSLENSWLQSRCYDLSAVDYPQVQFEMFLETERKYDGAKLQYSIDGGSNWVDVSMPNGYDNCYQSWWYNEVSVNFLGGTPGWSGNSLATVGSCQGGNGSNGWQQAKMIIPAIANQPQVYFRFVFGAGTLCNNFDGFAIDRFMVQNYRNTASITKICGTGRSVNFSTTPATCPATYNWNFGDPASGSSNVAQGASVQHVFSAAQNYTVSLNVSFDYGLDAIRTDNVRVFNLQTNVESPVLCFGDSTAAVSAIATGATNPVNFVWNTTPVTNGPMLQNIPAGQYIVTATSANACTIYDTVVITQPEKITVQLMKVLPSCLPVGSISANLIGGTAPYSYLWSNGNTTAQIQQLAAGTYNLVVTDANGCSVDSSIVLQQGNEQISVSLGADKNLCPGESLTLQAGSFSTYQWQDGSTSASLVVSQAGEYWVRVTDAGGCVASDTVKVSAECREIVFPSAFSPNGSGGNEKFGPLGSLGLISSFELRVYNRYGQLVFYSDNPYLKWDGKVKGIDQNLSVFVYECRFVYRNQRLFKKGSILLLR